MSLDKPRVRAYKTGVMRTVMSDDSQHKDLGVGELVHALNGLLGCMETGCSPSGWQVVQEGTHSIGHLKYDYRKTNAVPGQVVTASDD